MVQRYVYERSHGEIAAALGISGDAVAMRLTRGKHALRLLLAEAEWRPCGVACTQCGVRKLVMRRTGDELAFTCPGCAPDGILIRYPLANPQFARLVAGLQRPTAMMRRVGDWISRYFAAGDGSAADCTRCGSRVTVRAYRGDRAGLFVRCSSCGEQVWSALTGIAAAQPGVRALRPHRVVDVRRRRGAVEVVHASDDGRTATVGFDHATFALLG
jgi:DNA-directed RNA polymerase subunit RPC12/RpoP